MEVGGPQGRSGRVGKMSPTMESDPRTVQPVASGYTNCAIPVHTTLMLNAFHVVLVLYFDGSKNCVNFGIIFWWQQELCQFWYYILMVARTVSMLVLYFDGSKNCVNFGIILWWEQEPCQFWYYILMAARTVSILVIYFDGSKNRVNSVSSDPRR